MKRLLDNILYIVGLLVLLAIGCGWYQSSLDKRDISEMPLDVQSRIYNYVYKVPCLTPNDIVVVTDVTTNKEEYYVVDKMTTHNFFVVNCLEPDRFMNLGIGLRAGIEATKQHSFEFIPKSSSMWRPRDQWTEK